MPSNGSREGLPYNGPFPAAFIVIWQQEAYSNRLTRIELLFSKIIYRNVVGSPYAYATRKIRCSNRVHHIPHVGNSAKVLEEQRARSDNIAIAQRRVIKA